MLGQNSRLLTVTDDGRATALGIPAPLIDGQAPAALAVRVTTLPSNGTILLADGTTEVAVGQGLTVDELTGLTFRARRDAAGSRSTFGFSVTDPTGALVTSAIILAIAGAAMPQAATTALLNSLLGTAAVTPAAPGDHAAAGDSATASVAPMDIAAALKGTARPTSADDGTIVAGADLDESLRVSPLRGSDTSQPLAAPAATAQTAAIPADVDEPAAAARIGSGGLIAAAASPSAASSVMQTAFAPPPGGSARGDPNSVSRGAAVLPAAGSFLLTDTLLAATAPAGGGTGGAGTTDPGSGAGGTGFAAAAAAPANPIVLENQKPGTPRSVWEITAGDDSDLIQGFTTAISTNVGNRVDFKINNRASNANYTINIYRLGYYGGDGATLVTTIQHQSGRVTQPAPLKDAATGLVDAGNWSVTDSWAVPSTATSGVYIANVIDGNEIFQIPFVIRNDASHSDIVFQTSDSTWQAYNGWGGSNVYGGNGPGDQGAAYAVSYNRPITTRDGSTGPTGGGVGGTLNDMVFSGEYPAIEWLEQNGYDVSYVSSIDVATNGALLLNHKVYMDAGHDEYWTNSQRANVQAAADAGVNLMFLSGNEIYWQTRLAPSIDASATANRTLITYKDTHANAVIDPTGVATGTYMDARFASSGGMSGLPSNQLTGTVFQVDSDRDDAIKIPFDMSNLRFWRNTAVSNIPSGSTATTVTGVLGYEWDSSPDNGFRPAGLVDLSSTTLQVQTYLLDYGNTVGNGTATHNLVEYRDPVSGALVFGAGTVFWSWGLSDEHDARTPIPPVDPNIQQATVNLLADMGVQPQTLQASLVIASQSTDHTAPTATISNLSTTRVAEGQTVTVTGTASDSGGVIGGVEVSSDGGLTWHPASAAVGNTTTNWTYSFTAGAPGSYQVKARAVDDSVNLGAASAGVAYTVTPVSNLTMFKSTDVPAVITENDSGPVELGVKFTVANSGQITGIRFYKGPQNTGTHIGDLWTSSGTLLATATFTGETASGWQQVNFATPINVSPGTTYIASYNTTVGRYSDTNYYFDNAGHTNGALTAVGNGLNGVFAYGSGPLFPSNVAIANGTNYWVDVVFNDTSGQPQARSDSGFAVTENQVLSIPASALLANDSDPAGLSFSISGVSSPLNGAVTYNASTQTVTYTPTANFAGQGGFTYTITDTAGASGSGQVSVTVNYPVTAQSLFATNAVPGTPNVSDSPVELGMKFTASGNGLITGLRFYKGTANTGTHTADLWSATGTLLATATFTNETASGWQQVSFSQPVAITAGTTYIAAYHSSGNYSADLNYFTAPVTNGELSAPVSAGVYTYGSGSVFPTNSYKSSNYWVDVVFNGGTLQTPVAVNDSGFTAPENGTLALAASALLANDSDPNGLPLSISGVSAPTHGTVSYNATTQQVSFTPTTGYVGPASFSYTVTDGQGSATANVALNVSPAAPVANADSGFVTNENTSLAIAASALLANDTDPSGLTMSITSVGNAHNGTVSYNASTQTVTFVPASNYIGSADFTYSITDANGGVSSAAVSLLVNDPTAQSLFSPNAVPATLNSNDFSPVELGVRFSASASGVVTGIRFYKAAQNTGTHTGELWSSTGTLLATATFTNETASGWQQVNFSTPVSITAGTTYVASYHTSGGYSDNTNFFTSPVTNGSLTAPSANNGVYAYGATSIFPTSTYNASNYWVDVVYSRAAQPPVAVDDSGFSIAENGTLTIQASALLANDSDPDGRAFSISSVGNPTHGTVSYNGTNQTVTFVPTANYAGPASFSYTITDTAGGTASATASLVVTDTGTASLFAPSFVPALVTVNDRNAVELGMKFQSSQAGQITGIAFYKGSQNTGTHTGELWSSTGTLLASATFTNETASGWQQVTFATPVTITAGTTYIASYHTNGQYSADPNYFATAHTNGPLTAPSSSSSGGNGVYAYGGSSLFPTNTYNSTSYAVDVLFKAQLAA